METQRCKGARDLLPDDMERFRQVEDVFRTSCTSWGYREIRTPTLEYIHLFTAAGTLTPSMLGRVYSFLDWDGWGGERVVLRPDGTIPAARLYSESFKGSQIARLYYVTSIFAFEETGRENREKWQCGVEMLGDASPASDAEIIALALEILGSLGVEKIRVKLSHAGVLKAIIDELRLDGEAKSALLDELLDGNWGALAGVKSKNQELNGLISSLTRLNGKSGGFLASLQKLPTVSASLKKEIHKFSAVTGLLDELGLAYDVDFTSVRSFEYYTGLCFKIVSGRNKLCSGGRYDNLVNLVGGLAVPACGFAFYMDELDAAVKPWSKQKTDKTVLVKAAQRSADCTVSAFTMARTLREVGLTAELALNGSQLRSRWSVTCLAGSKGYTLRDEMSGRQKNVAAVDDVLNIIGGFVSLGR